MFRFLRSGNMFKKMMNEVAKELGMKQNARGKGDQDITKIAQEFSKELGLTGTDSQAGKKDLVKEVMNEAGKELGITENTTKTNVNPKQLAKRITEEIQERK
ncbi:hypothetical protein [Laceyella putida]|uniref:Uncharacterized protein n=1 Tax=Laceyella putida TaxID=110101 RepID=A0ABW2RMF3_9BACL